jgi:hypothetical protein
MVKLDHSTSDNDFTRQVATARTPRDRIAIIRQSIEFQKLPPPPMGKTMGHGIL